MKINPFFRCDCGKLHAANWVSWITQCKCGRYLMEQIPANNILNAKKREVR
jgi:hypothetical protein